MEMAISATFAERRSHKETSQCSGTEWRNSATDRPSGWAVAVARTTNSFPVRNLPAPPPLKGTQAWDNYFSLFCRNPNLYGPSVACNSDFWNLIRSGNDVPILKKFSVDSVCDKIVKIVTTLAQPALNRFRIGSVTDKIVSAYAQLILNDGFEIGGNVR